MTTEKEEESLIQFPCDFPIKIIGITTVNYLGDIIKIVRHHFPDFDTNLIQHKHSEHGKYTALTIIVHALNKVSLDKLYMEITQHPNTKMVF